MRRTLTTSIVDALAAALPAVAPVASGPRARVRRMRRR